MLQDKSSDSYMPCNYADGETSSGEIVPGQWRNEIPNDFLQPLNPGRVNMQIIFMGRAKSNDSGSYCLNLRFQKSSFGQFFIIFRNLQRVHLVFSCLWNFKEID